MPRCHQTLEANRSNGLQDTTVLLPCSSCFYVRVDTCLLVCYITCTYLKGTTTTKKENMLNIHHYPLIITHNPDLRRDRRGYKLSQD